MFKNLRRNAAAMCGVIAMNCDANVTELYRTLTETK